MNQKQDETYVCLGTCQAVIDKDAFDKGLTKCGAESCDMYQKPFVKGHKDEATGSLDTATV